MTTQLCQVTADGMTWTDPDGRQEWPAMDAEALADALQVIGYDVAVICLEGN